MLGEYRSRPSITLSGNRWRGMICLAVADGVERRRSLSMDRTARPCPIRPNWDDIQGAHGSTPELEGFRDLADDIRARRASGFSA